jgi:amino acid transporter
VIHTSLPLVITFYILANTAYYLVLPSSVINSSNTIAVAFGQQVFGRVGSLILALLVAGSCFGALNATTFTSGRLVYAAGKEGLLPELFGRVGIGGHDSGKETVTTQFSRRSGRFMRAIGDGDSHHSVIFQTPIYAMMFNATLTAIYVIIGEFSTLLTFYGVAGYTFYFFTVLGLIVLRAKEPDLERPYKTWITTPIIFCCVSLFLLSRAVFREPQQTLIVVAFVAAGVPIYFWRVKRRDGKRFLRGEGVGWKFWKRWIR